MESAYYLSLFLDEGREKLHQVGQLLVELEAAPQDAERIAQVFREIHSFKGNADTMGFADLTGLAHAMEEVLDGLRLGVLTGDAPLMRLLGRGLVALEIRLGEVEAGASGEIPAALVSELAAVASRIEWPASRPSEPESDPCPEFGARVTAASRTWRVAITLDAACYIKGTRAFMITTALEMLGAVLDITPSLEELDWPEAGDTFEVLLMADADPAAIRAGLVDIGEIVGVAITEQAPAAPARPAAPLELAEPARQALARALAQGATALCVTTTFLPGCRMPGARAALALNALAGLGEVLAHVPAPADMPDDGAATSFQVLVTTTAAPDALRSAVDGVGEVLMIAIETFEAAAALESVVRAAEPAALPPGVAAFPELPESAPEAQAGRRSRILRISTDRLDDLTALAEQLYEANARVARLAHAREHVTGPLNEAASDAAALAASLLEALTGLRRVPLETVFGRFQRMVRELAHELGKQVNVQVLGGDLEIDRSLADELSDLLVHLLRNAVDHGLETPAERHLAGKGAVGTLQLAARREGGQMVLTVADDGRGIDPVRLAEAARRKGWFAAGEELRLDDQALLELIFAPGFSTTEVTTRVSGRGVGLDAVKAKAEALGGRLNVESTPGRGTIFQLRFAARETHQARPDERVGA